MSSPRSQTRPLRSKATSCARRRGALATAVAPARVVGRGRAGSARPAARTAFRRVACAVARSSCGKTGAANEATELAVALAGRDGEIAGRPVTGDSRRGCSLAAISPVSGRRRDGSSSRTSSPPGSSGSVTDPRALYTLLFDVRPASGRPSSPRRLETDRALAHLAAQGASGRVSAPNRLVAAQALPVAVGPDGASARSGAARGRQDSRSTSPVRPTPFARRPPADPAAGAS